MLKYIMTMMPTLSDDIANDVITCKVWRIGLNFTVVLDKHTRLVGTRLVGIPI